jgi:hypothetical protein
VSTDAPPDTPPMHPVDRVLQADPSPASTLEDAPEADRLATQVEAMRAAEKAYRERADRLKANRQAFEERLRDVLAADTGEVAVAHNSGRIAYVETGFLGAAGPNAEGLRRHADAIADLGLAPQVVEVENLPSVSAIRAQEAALRERGINVRELLDEAAEGPLLRWRKAAPRAAGS